MSAVIVDIASRRPKVRVYLRCAFCGAQGGANVIAGLRYYPCPDKVTGCDEEAAERQYVVMARF